MTRGRLRGALHPLYRYLETQVHPLRYLFLEITQRCNLSCRHCGTDCGRDPQVEELSTEEWLEAIDLVADRFGPKVFLVVTGGEPLCHPELDRISARVAAHGFRWGMVSNGWLLTKERLAALTARGLVSLTVSLDGAEAQHDWLRGREGSYRRASAGIRAAVEARVPLLDVVTCVHPGNLGQLDDTLAHLQALGVKRWRIFTIFPKGRAATGELRLSDEQQRDLFAWIAATRAALEAGKIDFTLDFACEGCLPAPVDKATRDEPYFCRAGIAIGSILADGTLGACPNIDRALTEGNLRVDDLGAVWERGYQRFRDRSWMQQGACEACDDWGRCQGNSMHLWDSEAGHTVMCHIKLFDQKK